MNHKNHSTHTSYNLLNSLRYKSFNYQEWMRLILHNYMKLFQPSKSVVGTLAYLLVGVLMMLILQLNTIKIVRFTQFKYYVRNLLRSAYISAPMLTFLFILFAVQITYSTAIESSLHLKQRKQVK